MPARNNTDNAAPAVRQNGVKEVLAYTIPRLKKGALGDYIEFWAYDPAVGRNKRKRIKLNRIGGSRKEFLQFANERLRLLSNKLADGWNPWIDGQPDNYIRILDVIDHFDDTVHKHHSNGYYRDQTRDDYKSKLRIIRRFIDRNPGKFIYMFQFDHRFIRDFLDYLTLDLGNSPQTHNNYLIFLRMFSRWLLERRYIKTDPTAGMRAFPKRLITKERTIIPQDIIEQIGAWTDIHDPHMHFACLMLYYTFVRPQELCRLKVRDFDLQRSVLTVPGSASKNKTTQSVTLPKKVVAYGIKIGVFSAPMGDYVFSRKLRPGKEKIDPKIFRDHWAKIRKALKLKEEYKFYSLKDTGITYMLRQNVVAPVNVKDQARHSSLSITEIYLAPNRDAVPEILNLDGAL